MKNKSLISIIVPVYNCGSYLPKCIESIINQSYKDLELIMVNDGSTDDSKEICSKFAKKENRIKVIDCDKNSGPATARNIGLKDSNGDFIFFADGDDYLEPNALKSLIQIFQQQPVDLVIGDFKNIKDNFPIKRKDNVFLENRLLSKNQTLEYCRLYLKKPNRNLLFAFSWARLFKSSIIKKNNLLFNSELHTFEDVAFNFDYLKNSDEVYFLREIIYNHLLHENYSSATMGIGQNPYKLLGYQQALVSADKFLKGHFDENLIKKDKSRAYISLSIIQLIRACGQINKENRKIIYQFTKDLINQPEFRESLKFYSPSQNESKIIPLLMRLKCTPALMEFCRYKANRRYK